ncbi:EamA family transporter [Algoriphagus hitonicola]|uniref:Threonine/homoserine efflux transporter RhtA n=1 Tax=Algoriphagus hitonicola TaxID=435880 RepID=A0A1I2U315_9BACT|nr:EamA family transporter [Algoriphagus hitonicola]SFG68981.1 Threonine/homoserine efflux transporter RhtA [Algoriphagus hitonicola]
MKQTSLSPQNKGFLLALFAAIFWGVAGNCAQFLFEQKQLEPAWLVTWRLLLAGFILLLIDTKNHGSKVFRIWKSKQDVLSILIFGILGMLAVQYTYFYSIQLSNAATATVIQYLGPVFIVAYFAIKHRKWPVAIEFLSLGLALGGTFLLVTHGTIDTLVISKQAFIWGILSALTFAFYSIYPIGLLSRFSSVRVTGWAMLIGGLAFSFQSEPWIPQGQWDVEALAAFSFIIIFGSILSFLFFMTALPLIGSQTASLICSVEPLSAAFMAVIWLGVSFTGMDWLGTFMILGTVALLTLATKTKKLAI